PGRLGRYGSRQLQQPDVAGRQGPGGCDRAAACTQALTKKTPPTFAMQAGFAQPCSCFCVVESAPSTRLFHLPKRSPLVRFGQGRGLLCLSSSPHGSVRQHANKNVEGSPAIHIPQERVLRQGRCHERVPCLEAPW